MPADLPRPPRDGGTTVCHACGHTYVHYGVSARIGTRAKQLGRLADEPCPTCRLTATPAPRGGGGGGPTEGGSGDHPAERN